MFPTADIRLQWIEVGKVAFNSSEYTLQIHVRGSFLSPVSLIENKFAVKLMKKSNESLSITFPILDSDNFQSTDLLLLVEGVSAASTLLFADKRNIFIGS